MLLKTIEQERAEAEAMVKDMQIIGKERRLEHSQYVSACDDYDMDTTETLYYDEETNKYYLRVEMNHDVITSDGVDRISRTQANEWLRYNKRADFKAPLRRIRQILTFYGKRYYNFRKMIYKHLRKKA